MSILIRSAFVAAALLGGASAALAQSSYSNYTHDKSELNAKAFFELQQKETSR